MPTRRARSTRSPREKYTVFISHSTADLFIAKVMAEKIKANGGDAWLDAQNLEGGAPLKEQIVNGMKRCKEAVVLVSAKSVDSLWVTFEIGLAAGRGRRVTPILINVPYNANSILADLKAIDLNDFDDYLKQLKHRLRQWKQKKPR
jgi:hypothetical protein